VAAAVGGLLLRVEVHGGDREPQVVAVGEGAGGEAHARRLRPRRQRRRRRHAGLLLERHHHVAVDAHRRPRAHVRHHQLTCTSIDPTTRVSKTEHAKVVSWPATRVRRWSDRTCKHGSLRKVAISQRRTTTRTRPFDKNSEFRIKKARTKPRPRHTYI
jgi:hypothetical protein